MIFYCEFVCHLFYVMSWLLSGPREVLKKITSEKFKGEMPSWLISFEMQLKLFYSKKC